MKQCTTIPDVAGMTPRQAALAYAAAGLYVVPVRPGTKNPGSVVGENWPALSTVDTAQIELWWGPAGNEEYGIAVHCGKSGVVVFDVDDPHKIPEDEAWYDALRSAPWNSTRSDIPRKGHYFFRMPADKKIGNGKSGFPKNERAWGDVRGANGVVILPPSRHPNAADGGEYKQQVAGDIPELPAWLREKLTTAQPGEYALTSAEVKMFLRGEIANDKPYALKNVLQAFANYTDGGESRHVSAVLALCWAFREARAGFYPAQVAHDAVRDAWLESLGDEDLGERRPGDGEWQDIVRWAAAQARLADVDKVRDEAEARQRQREEDLSADGLYRIPPGVSTDYEHAQTVIRWIRDQAVYARDGDTWIMRNHNSWVQNNSTTASGIIALVAGQMPQGKKIDGLPEKPADKRAALAAAFAELPQKDIDEYYLHEMREKYQNIRTSAGIAQQLRAVVTGEINHQYTVTMRGLDADPLTLWTPEGPYDILGGREGGVEGGREIDRNEVHLRCTKYAPKQVPTPLWDEFIAAVWPDEQLRRWALQVLSVGLTGYSDKFFVYLYGKRNMGKTQIARLIADLLGNYGRTDIKANILLPDAQPWDVAALHGLRFGFIDETPSSAKTPTSQLKMITGDAELNAAYKGKQPFTFDATHTLVFASNDEPSLKDPAVVDRTRLVPCQGNARAVKAARQAIGHLSGPAWRLEAPGVLWQLCQYAKTYAEDVNVVDLQREASGSRRLRQEIVADQDMVARWLYEIDVLEGDWNTKNGTEVHTLFDSFADWCGGRKSAKDFLLGKEVRWFSHELAKNKRSFGLSNRRSNGRSFWNISVIGKNVKWSR